MKRNDKLLLPMTLAAALSAAPVLAQSPAAQGGATADPSRAGSDTRPSTLATTQTTTGGTAIGTAQELSANSVARHRPRLSQLIGSKVYNHQGETIGEVDDILLGTPMGLMGMGKTGTGGTTGTPATGPVRSGTTATPGMAGSTPGTMMPGMRSASMQQGPLVVIQVGGFLGMGGRLVVVPLSELQWNTERERVVMPNATKESLQGRPAFTYDLLGRG